MRLLKLRIENINSLAGRYEIDFTNRDYVESGIFATCRPHRKRKDDDFGCCHTGAFWQNATHGDQNVDLEENRSRLYGSDRRPQTVLSVCCLRIHGKVLAVALER